MRFAVGGGLCLAPLTAAHATWSLAGWSTTGACSADCSSGQQRNRHRVQLGEVVGAAALAVSGGRTVVERTDALKAKVSSQSSPEFRKVLRSRGLLTVFLRRLGWS